MEKAKISSYQLFVLMFIFLHGTAMLVPLAIEAKKDAWLSILLGMGGGFILFWIQYRLFVYYPDMTPVEYIQKIMGRFFGSLLCFFYILYFIYLAARVMRDFGSMLLTTFYLETPLFIVNALLFIVVIYALQKGIEVIARTGEMLFIFLYILAIAGFVLIFVSGLIDINNLKPVLEEGIKPIIKVAATQTLYVPFGEAAVVFSSIFPYLKNNYKTKSIGWFTMCLSGINLAIIMAVNVSVQGVKMTTRSQYPLLTTIQTIQVAEFLERLDVFFMFAAVLGVFFKVSLYLYVAVSNTAVLFKIKKPSQLVYPLGLIVLFLSVIIAASYPEHIEEGLVFITSYVHPVFQLVIPVLLLSIAFLKNRKQQNY